MKIIVTKDCKQCERPFQFISRRYGRCGSHRSYCEVCRELRIDATVRRYKERRTAAKRRIAIRMNAIACHEGAQ